MTVPSPHIDDEVRAGIRRRAEAIRRRQKRFVAVGVVLALAVGGVVVGAATSGGGGHRELIVGSPCPASGLDVPARSGEQATFTALPSGWTVTGDGTHLSQESLMAAAPGTATGPTVAAPGAATVRPVLNSNPLPSISLHQAPTGSGASQVGASVQVGSMIGTESVVAASDGQLSQASITWTPAPGIQLGLQGTGVPPAELLAVARGLRFQPGTVAPLPATAHARVSASKAEHALPSGLRRRATAVLSSWLEIDHVRPETSGSVSVTPGADNRPAWLVSARAGSGDRTWAIVDATTGRTLQGPVTGPASWISAVTDRAGPGCQPPLGVLTRTEASQAIFGSPTATAGSTLALIYQSEFTSSPANAVQGPNTCEEPCDPLIWVSRSTHRLATYDAITGEPEFEESGGDTPVPAIPAEDLDPGPTVTAPATTTTTPAPTAPPTTYAIVGPSPFLPGTMDPKPTPDGNGNGPQGSCNGTETTPPCGPGVQPHRYYAYTLNDSCDQDVRFDGRLWRQELLPSTNQGYVTVWMILSNPTGAGCVGTEGAVGMTQAPAQPPSCPQTNPSIPPISSVAPAR